MGMLNKFVNSTSGIAKQGRVLTKRRKEPLRVAFFIKRRTVCQSIKFFLHYKSKVTPAHLFFISFRCPFRKDTGLTRLFIHSCILKPIHSTKCIEYLLRERFQVKHLNYGTEAPDFTELTVSCSVSQTNPPPASEPTELLL